MADIARCATSTTSGASNAAFCLRARSLVIKREVYGESESRKTLSAHPSPHQSPARSTALCATVNAHRRPPPAAPSCWVRRVVRSAFSNRSPPKAIADHADRSGARTAKRAAGGHCKVSPDGISKYQPARMSNPAAVPVNAVKLTGRSKTVRQQQHLATPPPDTSISRPCPTIAKATSSFETRCAEHGRHGAWSYEQGI